MNGKLSKYLTSFIFLLGVIGLLVLLFNEPIRLVRYIVGSIIVIGIVYFVMKRFMFSNQSFKKEQKAFIKAARQSKKRTKKGAKQANIRKQQALRKRYASNAHLTVIEGKKGKKKNRALH